MPNITQIQPNYGPRVGGTLITVTGPHLDAGKTRRVTLNDQPCPIKRCLAVATVFNLTCLFTTTLLPPAQFVFTYRPPVPQLHDRSKKDKKRKKVKRTTAYSGCCRYKIIIITELEEEG